MPKRIQFRRDIAENWAFHNPRLMPGEIGLETDTQKFKIGDGDLDWEDLPYYLSIASQEGALDEAVDAAVLDATNLASGYKDAAAGSAAAAAGSATAADTSADASATSATEAAASAVEAEAAAAPTDALVAGYVADTGSDTNDAIETLISASSSGGIVAMNTSARDALGTVPDGTTIFNTTHNRLETYKAPIWVHHLSMPETLGAAYTTQGADLDLGTTGHLNHAQISGGYLRRDNFSGSSTFDVSDGMGGASSGYGTINAPCANYQGVGSNQPGYEETSFAGITLNMQGFYLFTNKAVVKSNGGSGRNMEIYLRKGSSGTRTGGTGIMSWNVAFTRYDNIYHEFSQSTVFMHTGVADYNVVYTMGTSAANLSSLGYGTGWQLYKLSDL